MTRVNRVLLALVATAAACACPPKKPAIIGAGSGSDAGSGSAVAPPASACDAMKTKVEAMYRTEAAAQEPKRAEEATSDNTAMVLGECAKAPDKVVPCLQSVTTVKDLEAKCMPQLSDEGSEADVLKQ